MTDTFITAILCIDGRYHRCLVDWLTDRYGADYVDLITQPGPDRILGEHPLSDQADGVRRRVDVSLSAHASRTIAMVGHDDCAGNPVAPDIHRAQVQRSTAVLREWYPATRIVGLFVDTSCAIHVVDALGASVGALPTASEASNGTSA